jgi:hypothetical protein
MTKLAWLLPEVIDHIVQHLSYHEHPCEHLRAAGLVAWAWVEPAQRCLFSSIHVDERGYHQTCIGPQPISNELFTALASRPDLARFVREISYTPNLKTPRITFRHDMFPNVTRFIFLDVSPATTAIDLPGIISGWAQLEHLQLDCGGWDDTYGDGLAEPSPFNVTATMHLTSVHLSAEEAWIISNIISHLAQTRTKETLRSATLFFAGWQGSEVWPTSAMYLKTPFASSVRQLKSFWNLKDLVLSLTSSPSEWFSDKEGPTRTYFDTPLIDLPNIITKVLTSTYLQTFPLSTFPISCVFA